MTDARPLHTEAGVAEVLGISTELVGKWRRKFDWPCVRFGRQVRFTDEQLAEIVRRHTVTPSPAAPAEGIPGQSRRSAARWAR